ncbi:MAG: hypothetical protein ACFCUQ_21410 [Kiloniellales bacterium]
MQASSKACTRLPRLDGIDTIIKGAAYFESLGVEYPIRVAAYIALCLIAMATASQRFHAAFVAVSLVYQCQLDSAPLRDAAVTRP